MNSKVTTPPGFDEAVLIMNTVSKHKRIPVKRIQAGIRRPKVSYARSLMVYMIKTNTSLPHKDLSSLLNLNSHNGIHYCYTKMKRLVHQREDVKEEIKFLTDKLKVA